MEHPIITIDDPSAPRRPEGGGWLRNRKLLTASGLAVAEVVAYLLIDPPRWLAIVVVGAALAALIAISGRMRPGTGRDLALIGALAQAMLLALPVLVGFVTLVFATVVVLALIGVFVLIGLRFRR